MFVRNWRGDFIMPAEKDKPASGFVAETDEYPESSIDFSKAITLKPLKAGALQPYSLQEFMQDETRQLQNRVASQLMKEWAEKVDNDFLNADSNPATEPRGLKNIAGIETLDAGDGANGSPLSFNKCLQSEGLLRARNQFGDPVWIINSKTATHARSKLRNNVAGSIYIGTTSQIADRRFVESNVVSSTVVKGSGADLSEMFLVVPSSVVIVHWALPTIEIDRSIGFKSDTVWVKMRGYCNIGLKRPKDLVRLHSIDTDA